MSVAQNPVIFSFPENMLLLYPSRKPTFPFWTWTLNWWPVSFLNCPSATFKACPSSAWPPPVPHTASCLLPPDFNALLCKAQEKQMERTRRWGVSMTPFADVPLSTCRADGLGMCYQTPVCCVCAQVWCQFELAVHASFMWIQISPYMGLFTQRSH